MTTVRLRNCKNEIPKKVHQNILYDCPMIINLYSYFLPRPLTALWLLTQMNADFPHVFTKVWSPSSRHLDLQLLPRSPRTIAPQDTTNSVLSIKSRSCIYRHRQPKRTMCGFGLQRSFGRNILELLVYYLMLNKRKNLKDMKSSCLSICTSSL